MSWIMENSKRGRENCYVSFHGLQNGTKAGDGSKYLRCFLNIITIIEVPVQPRYERGKLFLILSVISRRCHNITEQINYQKNIAFDLNLTYIFSVQSNATSPSIVFLYVNVLQHGTDLLSELEDSVDWELYNTIESLLKLVKVSSRYFLSPYVRVLKWSFASIVKLPTYDFSRDFIPFKYVDTFLVID